VRAQIVPVIIRALGTIMNGLDQSRQLLPGSSVGHRAAGHTNEHCTQRSVSAGGNGFDLLLRSGLTRRPPPGN
jgi:hypothetical protein